VDFRVKFRSAFWKVKIIFLILKIYTVFPIYLSLKYPVSIAPHKYKSQALMKLRHLWLSRQWRFKLRSSGLWCHVVSEVHAASIFSVKPSETMVSYHITTRHHNREKTSTWINNTVSVIVLNSFKLRECISFFLAHTFLSSCTVFSVCLYNFR
jgi:hypothetical protein